MKSVYTIAAVIIAASLAGCTYTSQGIVVSKDRYAEALKTDHFGDSADKIVYLDQNWDRWDSLWFYNTTQGSNFLPYDIFVNLEQKDNQVLFRDSENMSKYRYLTQRDSWDNPDGLPLGFVKDSYLDNDYVGFTCAACHTTQINYQSTGIRIDGGPSLADMDGMLLALEEALIATQTDDEKFQRMATRISNDHDKVRLMLAETTDKLKTYNHVNRPTNGEHMVDYGYGRLDAFGRIYNRVLGHLTPGNETSNFNPPNAPVSYPFLWDTPQHDFVQWNGVANNNDGSLAGFLGPLGRNTGEVLGVFASFSLEKQKHHLGYKASADKRNLLRLEQHLIDLESPQWPEDILPKIDRTLAQKGEEVFKAYRCQQCHSDDDEFIRNNPRRQVTSQFASVDMIGTDKQMASNAISYTGKSGLFEGEPVALDPRDTFGEETPVVVALTKSAQGVIIARDPDKSWLQGRAEWLYDVVVALFNNPRKGGSTRYVDFEENAAFPESLNAYKARPLNGIWATAPYMHNGSVPTLYDMLLPSCSDAEISAGNECRPNRFTLASRELDPKKVGFVQRDISEYPSLFEFDTSLPANNNAGHEYAVGKTPIIKLDENGRAIRNADGSFAVETLPPINNEQRWALVEYLKTL
jgi:hypothetical protein